MDTKERKCPDCGGNQEEIRVIDHSHGSSHVDFQYAALDAKRNFWTGQYLLAGKITAFMCQNCGLIRMYGRPKSK